jgi:ribosomal protein S18 acetylase RimI-like enzyme
MVEAIRYRIREAQASDLKALEWEGEYKHFRRVYQQAMREAERGNRLLLVAEVNEELIGQIFIAFENVWKNRFREGAAAYLHSFRVKQTFRNQGIGRSLLKRAEVELIAHGYNRAVISVAKENDGALRLYESEGYRIFGEDQGNWSYFDHEGVLQHIHEPAYVLEKQL